MYIYIHIDRYLVTIDIDILFLYRYRFFTITIVPSHLTGRCGSQRTGPSGRRKATRPFGPSFSSQKMSRLAGHQRLEQKYWELNWYIYIYINRGRVCSMCICAYILIYY